MAKQARLQGLMVGSRRQQEDYVAALEQSGVRPVLDSSFPLDQLADALRYQASGVHFGKVAIEWRSLKHPAVAPAVRMSLSPT